MPDVDAVLAGRWKHMFASPDLVRQAANDFGYHVSAYTADGSGNSRYQMAGVQQVLPDAALPTHVTTDFAAGGHDKGRVDCIEFSFSVVRGESKPRTKKERAALQIPRRAVQGFLARFELGPSDIIKRALQDFTSATDRSTGGSIVIRSDNPGSTRKNLHVLIEPSP